MVYTNERETGIRTVRIEGVPVSISNQRGGVVIWGRRDYQGKTVTLTGRGGDTKDVHATFSAYRDKGHITTAAVFSRVKPGDYYTIGRHAGIDSIGWTDVSVSTQWVQQIDWR